MAQKSRLQRVYEKSIDLHQAAQKLDGPNTGYPGLVERIGKVTADLGALVRQEAQA